MTVLLENRTISMILMVPDVEAVSSSSTPIIEKLDRSDLNNTSVVSNVKHDPSSDNTTISSMPVYHGSILRIEQHTDDNNTSDLIIRVPNFHRQRLSSDETDNKPSPSSTTARIKRRAPICPLLYGPAPNLSTTNSISNLNPTRVTNTNRITTGLRSLSRAFTHSSKSKRSSNISEMPVPSSLPDIEVMNERLKVSLSSNKNFKNENSTSSIPKLTPPKVLFVKGKHFKMRKKQTSSSSAAASSTVSNGIRTDFEKNRINLTSTSTIITTQYAEVKKPNSSEITTFFQEFIEQKDFSQQTNIVEDNDNNNNDREQQDESMGLGFDVEQQFAAISQLISDVPLSSIDGESLSTHRYSTISTTIPDIRIFPPDNHGQGISPPDQSSSVGISYDLESKPSIQTIGNIISSKNNRPFRIQTSMLQPDISVIRIGITDLTTSSDRSLPGENISNEQIDSKLDSESIEDNENSSEQGWYEIFHPDDETFAESYEVTYQIDPKFQSEQEHRSDLTTWLPIISQNEYEHIESDQNTEQKSSSYEKTDRNLEHLQTTISKEEDILINNMSRTKSRSVDDLSRTSNDQTSTYQPESFLSSSSTSSSISSRHCKLQRSNSYNGFGVYVSTDIETHREHFIRQVEDSSPGEQAGLKENDRILCINGIPVIDEEYTVVLQLIKHGLQTDTLNFDVISNEAYEQFKSHIDQLYQ